MLPGPTLIIACPHCGTLARRGTLASGNTLRGTLWTDGKQVFPMLPSRPPVLVCRGCASPYRKTEGREIGRIEPGWLGALDAMAGRPRRPEASAHNPEWEKLPWEKVPTETEWYHLLESGFAADAAEEKRLRILAWWCRNEPARSPDPNAAADTAAPDGDARHNMEALLGKLDVEVEGERLMKAELLRELGEFQAALALLEGPLAANGERVARLIAALCQERDTAVQKVPQNE